MYLQVKYNESGYGRALSETKTREPVVLDATNGLTYSGSTYCHQGHL